MSSVDDGSEDLYGNATSRLRYEAYSRLQAAAVAFGESLPIPEIVAIGGQSDGKSSLLEAFLGFRFNVREVEMGTRRPLIVQMVHDSTAEEPRCRLKDEEGEEYGPVIAPPSAVADAIRDRTAEHLAKVGGAVSSVPIVMRAEYAYCPNLTIIDTPGFILKARKGEAASTPDDILAMVKAQCAPSNRLILFLQQSSVEWASSLWMHVLTDVDPDFSRTVVVASKFDNRLKEFGERWEVDRYLAAAGYLPPSVQPFFIALPKDRGAVGCAGEWRASIQGVDAEVLRGLREGVAGGFDEERFGARVGFAALRRFLEAELARRYRAAAPATLAALEARCAALRADCAALDGRVRALCDVGSLRRAALAGVVAVDRAARAVLGGGCDASPARHGRPAAQERAEAGAEWPVPVGVGGGGGRRTAGEADAPDAPDATDATGAQLRLYGSAAFARALAEFRAVVQALELPPVSSDVVANALLGQDQHGGRAVEAVAALLAEKGARTALGPALRTLCVRLGGVLAHALGVAQALVFEGAAMSSGPAPLRGLAAPAAGRPHEEPSAADLGECARFRAAIAAACDALVARLVDRARALLEHGLEVAVAGGGRDAWAPGHLDLLGEGVGEEEGDDEVDENASPMHALLEDPVPSAAARPRPPLLETQMTVPETPSPEAAVTTRMAARSGLGRQAVMAAATAAAAGAGDGHDPACSPEAKGRGPKAARVGYRRQRDASLGRPLSRRGRAGAAAGAAGGSAHARVCAAVAARFRRVCSAVASGSIPTSLQTCLLSTLREGVLSHLLQEVCGTPDADFMALFQDPAEVAALRERWEAAERRAEGLVRCRDEFGELVACL
ncbi:hypothetical protein ACKKBF_B17545 [Auxenochlorella protothecoides x Auxenochlorella symbiontica]